MSDDQTKDINALFTDGSKIDQAVKDARNKLILKHRALNEPLVIWKDGKVQHLSPDQLEDEEAA